MVTIRYSDEGVGRLLQAYEHLNTFAEVSQWDSQSATEIKRIEGVIEQLDTDMRQSRETAERERHDRAALPLLQRLFANRKAERDAEQHVITCQGYKAKLEDLATLLQDKADFTPNTPEDQKQLLKDLRQRKKELQVEKREVAAEMTAVRVEARRASASIGPSYGVKWVGTMNASERRRIRMDKENALRPNENRKAAIERQILEIDRRINWVERIK